MTDTAHSPIEPPFDGETENGTLPDSAAPQDAPPHCDTTKPFDTDDTALPMNSPARGPMDQLVPDVATGSTPVTRRDD